ncbi:DegT/DnrJ/EryC1/StrS aminotransferase family protein [bacterium]|jgi:dTDP-4-amino-4,6-dideoxygalactose transaminase|nr:DegT/DnrJ/EryC1/StrS aminotransferase family protein [bacterium]
MKIIQSKWPIYSEEEIDSVKSVLYSGNVNYWTGTQCRNFEKEFAKYVGVDYAVALSNGTVALDLALLSLGIGKDDEVIVTSRTFIASVSCIVNVGATPVFADVDLNTGNITSKNISKVISKKTKAIICVHLAGYPCDMDSIMELANVNELFVIEDCSQAHGARYKDKSVGSIGHIGTWSFCQDKIISTGGEGGMLTTNTENFWSIAWSYKDHGKSFKAVNNSKNNKFNWVHESIGTNWRMTEIQATIGRIQLTKLDQWREKRTANAEKILKMCSKFSNLLRVPNLSSDIIHAWYKCYVYLKLDAFEIGWSRDRVISEINAFGVPCYEGSCSEVYLEKAFKDLKPEKRMTNAKELGETSIMFLIHPNLTSEEIENVCEVIENVMTKARK